MQVSERQAMELDARRRRLRARARRPWWSRQGEVIRDGVAFVA